MKRVINIAFIIIFAVLLLIPIFTADFEGGKMSETENRQLASFPDMVGEEAIEMSEAPAAIEDWCSDNIGFKDYFRDIYKKFSNEILGIFPSDRAHKGKDDWYFTVSKNNIEIGKGEYLLSDEKLKLIAEYQQSINNYYKSRGKEYYLVLLPAKTTVYPEYISGGEFEVTYTLIDQVENYLKKHTDVKVVNTKSSLVEAKSDAQLYQKNDTHWTTEGSYVAYKTVMERLLKDGVIDTYIDINPQFVQAESLATGDLSQLTGSGLISPEAINVPIYKKNTIEDAESTKSLLLDIALDGIEKSHSHEIERDECKYINNMCSNKKTLLLYGDSMLLRNRYFVDYFAESFGEVQYVRVRNISRNIDTAVEPDIVIFEAYERLMEDVLTYVPDYYTPDEKIQDLEEATKQTADIWIGDGGFLIKDKSDEYYLNENKIVLSTDAASYTFSGWAIDYMNKSNLDGLYVNINGTYYPCNYGLPSNDVNGHFNAENMKNSRFSFNLTKQFIEENNLTELKFIMLSADNKHYYPEITYELSFE